jgi:hypothetical protein
MACPFFSLGMGPKTSKAFFNFAMKSLGLIHWLYALLIMQRQKGH